MLLWNEVEAQQRTAMKEKNDPDIIECPKCHSTFLEVIEVKQYRKDMPVGLSQPPPAHPRTHAFYFYRCVCGEVLEPPVSYSDNAVGRTYIRFVEVVKKLLNDA